MRFASEAFNALIFPKTSVTTGTIHNINSPQNLSLNKDSSYITSRYLQTSPEKICENRLTHDGRNVELKKDGYYIDGQPKILRGGSFQWFKLPKEVWEDRILRFKAAGYNTLDMYVSWKNHEPIEGKFDFEKYDVKHFLELAKKHDMYVVFRPGPYICNEIDSGGLPGWLIPKSRKDLISPTTNDGIVNLRTNDKDYLDAVKKYFSKVNEVIKPYLHTNGGPIILYSVENEYDWFLLLKEFDKRSTIDGKPERPIDQNPNIRDYLEKLSQFVRKDGIDIPITTCPGTGKVRGLANARDVAPMPNMYTGLKNAEYNTINLINDMHSDNHEGQYKNVPAGLTETSREANVLKRLVLGGMNSVLQFNNIGFFQDGYQNTIVFNGTLFDNAKNALENLSNMVNIKYPQTAFFRPSIGFFPGKGDYHGSAISPSGMFRDNFYNIRRANMFIDSYQHLIAKSYKPNRTFQDSLIMGQDRRVIIKNVGTGIIDPDHPKSSVNYWLDLGKETALIGIHNNGSKDQVLGKFCVKAFNTIFPKYSVLTVPIEHGLSLSATNNKPDSEYTMFLPFNFPISKNININYSTSEILTKIDFNYEKLLVVYGKGNTFGELKIDGKNIKINSATKGIKINEIMNNSFTISYKHAMPQSLSYTDESGKSGRIIILDTHMAGKTWFVDTKMGKVMLSGVDYVNTLNNKNTLEFSTSEINDKIFVYSNNPVEIPDCDLLKKFDSRTGISAYNVNKEIPNELFRIDISKGKMMRDYDEAKIDFDTNSWISLGDKPQTLEKHGIYNGHSWYRAEFCLDKKEIDQKSGLLIESAGDFEGIYINGHYISTVTPIGTEINNTSRDPGYRFYIPKEILTEGKNIIAFKSEIWGHGGILLPNGKLNRINAFGLSKVLPFIRLRIPQLSYDSQKGISGEAKFNNKPITNWKLRPGLGRQYQRISQARLQ